MSVLGPKLVATFNSMRSLIVHKIFLLAFIIVLPMTVHAQEGISKEKQERAQAKKKEDDKKEVRKKEKQIEKKHLANQDKATRKRLKHHKRRAEKHGNTTHRDPFLKRLFRRRH